MPATMLHLLTARKFDATAPTAFFVGSIAPDCIDIREYKDKNHYRNLEYDDRVEALRKRAVETDMGNPFEKGVLLHLYTDLLWDTEAFAHFNAVYHGDNWFRDYRHEIGQGGGYMYQTEPWAIPLFEEMLLLPQEQYCTEQLFPPHEIHRFIADSSASLAKKECIPSGIYTPEYAEEFCLNAAEKFRTFFDSCS